MPLLALGPALSGCAKPASEAQRPRTLSAAVAALFGDAAAGETRALVVMRGGRIVAERYGAGFTARTRQLGWSLSHCVTGLMTGLLVADGRLRLDMPAAVPGWQRPGDPRGAITVRMLLQMRSGLRDAAGGNALPLLLGEGRDDIAGQAEGQPLAATPGTRFARSAQEPAILADLAARTLSAEDSPDARRRAVAEYLRTRLAVPGHMDSLVAEYDARGTMIGSAMVWARPRDWARLGELLRQDGAVRGAQLVPRGWIAFMRRPSPASPAYGAMLHRRSGLLPAGIAPDAFGCMGEQGQSIIVWPSRRLTLVRLGRTADDPGGVLPAHLAQILRLAAQTQK